MTNTKKERKTDRRTIYTENVIKDGLLELLAATSFEKITVTAVCKQAEITRATFYLHFDDLTGVLDATLEDALRLTEQSSANPNQDMLQLLELLAGNADPEVIRQRETLLPACQRVADIPKYHVLFLDESLSDYIIKKMYLTEKDKMIPTLMNQCHLSKNEADKIFQFVIYGAYHVNKSMHWDKTKDWYQLQSKLIKFISGGLQALT
ncbi:MAG: TetR/AcrR family transcriptional regulator [Lachnospiraceae bacterium]|nr:TetR/AcrR family transcriptional regulator [Lachnospiraceae bacterium]